MYTSMKKINECKSIGEGCNRVIFPNLAFSRPIVLLFSSHSANISCLLCPMRVVTIENKHTVVILGFYKITILVNKIKLLVSAES